MPMPPDVPRTYDAAIAMVRRYAAGADAEKRAWAEAVLNSGSADAAGRFNVEFRNEPWANGAVWVLNPNPRLPHAPGQWTKARLTYTREMADAKYAKGAAGAPDGEYLDSLEGWADTLDFGPEAVRYSASVPTFSTDAHRTVVPTWLSVYDLSQFMSADLRSRGKLLMANSTPWRFHAFTPLLDVMGTETNWLPGGKSQPDSDALFNLRRTLCYHKPYLLLQNTDFDRFGPDRVEAYFQRSMFYGVFPSMFSVDAANHPYWEEPRWYNRDRPLFHKYIRAIGRLSAAGWEPVTWARTDNPAVYVERFGTTRFTVMNSSDTDVTARLTVDMRRLKPHAGAASVRFFDDIAGEPIATVPFGWSVVVPVRLRHGEARSLRLELDR
jgi:hypothetical protein